MCSEVSVVGYVYWKNHEDNILRSTFVYIPQKDIVFELSSFSLCRITKIKSAHMKRWNLINSVFMGQERLSDLVRWGKKESFRVYMAWVSGLLRVRPGRDCSNCWMKHDPVVSSTKGSGFRANQSVADHLYASINLQSVICVIIRDMQHHVRRTTCEAQHHSVWF